MKSASVEGKLFDVLRILKPLISPFCIIASATPIFNSCKEPLLILKPPGLDFLNTDVGGSPELASGLKI